MTTATVKYLEEAMEGAIATRALVPVSDVEIAAVRTKSVKRIAGFDVRDLDAEEKAVTDLRERKSRNLKGFIDQRGEITKQLATHDVMPLAIIPTAAWEALCNKAGLFRLIPGSRDFDGQVAYERGALRCGWATWQTRKKNWPYLLSLLFPKNVAYGGHGLTPILPEAPDDVQRILLRLEGKFAMETAVEPRALAFAEDLDAIRNNVAEEDRQRRIEERRRRLQAWANDPIVYIRFNFATAIIAQFGDFPIEKEVIDAAMKADALVPDRSSWS